MSWGQTPTTIFQYDLALLETRPSQLPDSIQTYKLQFLSEVSERFSTATAATARKTFQVGRLSYSDANNGVVLSVRVLLPLRQSKQQSRKAKDTGAALYRYEETIRMPVLVQLITASGAVLYRDTAVFKQLYSTPEFSTDANAQRAFDSRIDLPAYGALLREGYQKSINKAAKRLKSQYLSEALNVSLYYTNDMDTAVLGQIQAIRQVLLQYNTTLTPAEAWKRTEPRLGPLEAALTRQQGPGGNAEQARALALTLTNVYRCFGYYDQANTYLRPIGNTDPATTRRPTTDNNVSGQPERGYPSPTDKPSIPTTLFLQQKYLLVDRLDSLMNIRESRGFSVMTNGDTIRGVFLDLIENFNAAQVVFKYEKKLNAPILDAAYSLVHVREIHIPDWHLVVMQTDAQFELAEILHQSPNIIYCRLLPNLTDDLSVESGNLDFFYVKKTDEKAYTLFDYKSFVDLANYFDECPTVAQRFSDVQYKSSQLERAMMDYDSLCGNAISAKKIKIHRSSLDRERSPGYMMGINIGFNGYTGLGGLSFMTRFAPHVYGRFGIGLGLWGVKYSAGLKYDFRRDLRFKPGFSLAAGFTNSRGIPGVFQVSRNTSTTVAGNTVEKNVDVDILQRPANTIYFATVFNYFFTRRASLNLELGYAQSISKSPWVLLPGGTGREFARDAIKLYQPGGLLMGIGLHAGF